MRRFNKTFLVFTAVLMAIGFPGCVIFYEPYYEVDNKSIDDKLYAQEYTETNNYTETSTRNRDLGVTNSEKENNSFVVKEVIDGDTFILSNNQRIRLLGINAPEYGSYFHDEAKKMLELLVLKKVVNLEKDITDRDKYGRLLRYVYVDNLFVNLEMLKRGFACSYTCPPDIKYTDIFVEAERFARENEIGLWKRSIVSEISINLNYDANGDDRNNLNGEYVIIRNESENDINIRGWTVKDSSTNIYKFSNFKLKKGSCIYLFSGNGKDCDGKFYWNSNEPIWNNDHDTLYLRDKEGLLVEIYSY